MLNITDHGRVRELRIDRPPANALNGELLSTLQSSLDTAAAEADAVVVSGRPGMFSAGLDVPELLGLERAALDLYDYRGAALVEAVLADAAREDVTGALGLDRGEIAATRERIRFLRHHAPELDLPDPDDEAFAAVLGTPQE